MRTPEQESFSESNYSVGRCASDLCSKWSIRGRQRPPKFMFLSASTADLGDGGPTLASYVKISVHD